MLLICELGELLLALISEDGVLLVLPLTSFIEKRVFFVDCRPSGYELSENHLAVTSLCYVSSFLLWKRLYAKYIQL